MDKYFVLEGKTNAVAYGKMDNSTVKKLWKSFCLTGHEPIFTHTEECVFRIGNTPPPTIDEGKEYALSVTETGVAAAGRDYGALTRAAEL